MVAIAVPSGLCHDRTMTRLGSDRMTTTGKRRPCGDQVPFWQRKTLGELTPEEWESLCDRCGRCCLVKLEDEDTGAIHFTNVACRLFDRHGCRCSNYGKRSEIVGDCVTLDAGKIGSLHWLPPTCAYRLVADGKDLFWWHPLVSGTRDSVHQAGVSVKGRIAASEDQLETDALPDFIVGWPTKLPQGARRKK